MEINPTAIHAYQIGPQGMGAQAFTATPRSLEPSALDEAQSGDELKEKFQQFVAGTFYRTLLNALRSTVDEQKLLHGGKAEEIFRAQLDQTLVEKMADSHGGGIAEEMFTQFQRMMNPAAPGFQTPTELEGSPIDERRTTGAASGSPTGDLD